MFHATGCTLIDSMKFSRDGTNALTIRRVDPDRIRIGEVDYRQSVALTADRVLGERSPPGAAVLGIDDLEDLLGEEPEILLVGTGWRAERAGRELTFALARRHIGLEVMDTPAACRTFNILVGEGRKVAALLMLDQVSAA